MVRLSSLLAFASVTTFPAALAWNVTFLPLGDSITYGWESTDGNGYRLDLQNLAKAAGNTITYIGSIQAGTVRLLRLAVTNSVTVIPFIDGRTRGHVLYLYVTNILHRLSSQTDNWNDGYIGCVITQIATQSTPALAMVPHVRTSS